MSCCKNETMHATVCKVCPCHLEVCEHCTDQEVLVRTDNARCFCPGDHVCIHYDGRMTKSIPPQITADCVERISC